jgi:AcrR family transcriptional regulator
MQVLKQEIQEAIVRSAEKLFFKRGFSECTMRDIAEDSGVTLSNIYKYFPNKEAILDGVLREYYLSYKKKFDNFLEHDPSEEFSGNLELMMAKGLYESISGDRTKFVILMEKSAGTTYGKFKAYMADRIASHVGKEENRTERDAMYQLFAENLIGNLVSAAKSFSDCEERYRAVSIIVKFYLNGIRAVV